MGSYEVYEMKNTALDTRGQTVGMFFYEVPPAALFQNPVDNQTLAINSNKILINNSSKYSLIKSDKAYIRLDQVRGSYLINKLLLYKKL